ncbi:MAG: alpha/beta hydrolase [Bacteroidia bacterium]
MLLSGNKVVSYTDSEQEIYTVVLFHGFPFNKDFWQPQLSFFSSICRVVAYDVRGYGSSSKVTDNNFTVDDLGDIVLSLITTLQLNRVVLCGLFYGEVYIALNVIGRYPQHVSGIILCDTYTADTDEMREKRFHAIDLIRKEVRMPTFILL